MTRPQRLYFTSPYSPPSYSITPNSPYPPISSSPPSSRPIPPSDTQAATLVFSPTVYRSKAHRPNSNSVSLQPSSHMYACICHESASLSPPPQRQNPKLPQAYRQESDREQTNLFFMMQTLVVILQRGPAFLRPGNVLAACVDDVASQQLLPEREAARRACEMFA